MDKRVYRYIEKILYMQKDIELSVVDARADLLAKKGFTGGGGRAFISDPTAQNAIKMATPLKVVFVQGLGNVERPEELLALLEQAYATQREWRRHLLRKRYGKGTSIKMLSVDYDRSEKTIYNVCSAFVVDVGLRLASRGFIEYG